jgi:hypothetical protein
MIREIIFFTWSIINITVFILILYGLLRFIPKIKPKTRMILMVVGSLFYVGLFGISFGKLGEIYMINPFYPYEIIKKDVEFAKLGAFSLTGRVEYEIPKSDTLLKPRIRKTDCLLKGFYLGYTWDTPYAKGNIYNRNGKEILTIETHGKLEWRLLGIKIRSSTYSLSEDILIEK